MGSDVCRSLNGHVIAILFQRFDADTFDLDQILYRYEGSVFGPILDNGFSTLLADSLKCRQGLRVSGIDINRFGREYD